MKSFLCLFVLCAAIVSLSLAFTKEETIQKATEVGKKCQAQENASDADFNEFFAHQVPTTPAAKCLRACVMETFKVLIDNVPNTENSVELFKKFTNNNPEAIELLKEIHVECYTSAADRCETAYNIVKCTHEFLKKRGVELSTFFKV